VNHPAEAPARRWRAPADRQALAGLLTELANALITRLEGGGKLAILQATFRGIREGRSVAAIAREHGRTREHFSRTNWRLAMQLLAADLATMDAQRQVAYNGRRERKPTT
jgi:hypothetical protein